MATQTKPIFSRRSLCSSALGGAFAAASHAISAQGVLASSGLVADRAMDSVVVDEASSVVFNLPPDWQRLPTTPSVIAPIGLDQESADRAYIMVHNYTIAQAAFAGGKIVECALHGASRNTAEWLTRLRSDLSTLDPSRQFKFVGPMGSGMALDAHGPDRGWRTVYLEKSGYALGVTLVRSGAWLQPSTPAGDLTRALEFVANTLEPMPALSLEPGFPSSPDLALAARKRNRGSVGVEASDHRRRTNFWEERAGSSGFVSAERSVDWSKSRNNMKRNRTICRTSADRSFPIELVRNIVTQDSGSCGPRPLWSQQINKEFWRDKPADHIWTGSFTSRAVDRQTVFFTLLLQPGILYCLDHWSPFS